jgi:hypothetical protein
MSAKQATAGISFQVQTGRRTIGSNTKLANAARQKASNGPGQPAKYGAFAKNPLLLHKRAAANTHSTARRRTTDNEASWSPEPIDMGYGLGETSWRLRTAPQLDGQTGV